ncbi:MAG: pilus assembly protein PilM, partial [bacterium]
NEKIDKMMVSGGCINVPGLQELFLKKLEIPVEIMNPLKNIKVNEKKFDLEYIAHISSILAISVGLALRRIGDR